MKAQEEPVSDGQDDDDQGHSEQRELETAKITQGHLVASGADIKSVCGQIEQASGGKKIAEPHQNGEIDQPAKLI